MVGFVEFQVSIRGEMMRFCGAFVVICWFVFFRFPRGEGQRIPIISFILFGLRDLPSASC